MEIVTSMETIFLNVLSTVFYNTLSNKKELLNYIKNLKMKNDPVKSFIKDLDDCFIETINNLKLNHIEVQGKKYRLQRWLDIYKEYSNNYLKKNNYLPNSQPIIIFIDNFTSNKRNMTQDQKEEFINNFNKKISGISLNKISVELEEKLDNNFHRFEYLNKLIKNPEELYIQHDAILCTADKWGRKMDMLGDNIIEKASNIIKEDIEKNKEDINHRIVFINAELGIGKTSFINKQAELLAKNFLRTNAGCFPVVFDLKGKSDINDIHYFLESTFNFKKDNFPEICLFLDHFEAFIRNAVYKLEETLGYIIDLLKKLPLNSKIYIATRPIFTTNNKMSDFIEKRYDNFIKILPFDDEKIKEWFDYQGDVKVYERLKEDGSIKLIISNPFFLNLIKDVDYKEKYSNDQTSLALKTELYFKYVNTQLKNAVFKPLIEDTNKQILNKPVNIRSALQQFSVYISDFNKNFGEVVNFQSDILYHKNNELEFKHNSFGEYFAAEYLLTVLVALAGFKNEIKNLKQLLYLGIMTEETIHFLPYLIDEMFISLNKNESESVFFPLYDNFLKNQYSLKYKTKKLNFKEGIDCFKNEIKYVIKYLIQNDKPLFLEKSLDKNENAFLKQKFYILKNKLTEFDLYRENWIAFFILTVSKTYKKDKEIITLLKTNFNKISKLSIDIPDWVKNNIKHVKNLNELDFTNLKLKNTNFENASLSLSCFKNADLRYSNFNHATLQKADFRGANLEGATFYYSNLSESVFDGASLKNTNFVGSDLTSASFINSDFEYSLFDGDIVVTNTDFSFSNFTEAIFNRFVLGDVEKKDVFDGRGEVEIKKEKDEEKDEDEVMNCVDFRLAKSLYGITYEGARMSPDQSNTIKSKI